MNRRSPRRSEASSTAMSSPRTAFDHVRAMLQRLQEKLYRQEDWGLFTELRSTAESDWDVLRRADAIAVHRREPHDGWLLHGFEVKCSRADFRRELRHPEKSGPLQI